jgi:hypothetical protein
MSFCVDHNLEKTTESIAFNMVDTVDPEEKESMQQALSLVLSRLKGREHSDYIYANWNKEAKKQ